MDADLSGFEVDLLALAEHRAPLQIDDAGLAERVDHRAVLRVELDETVASRDINHAFVAPAVGPVRDAAAGQLARRDGGPVAFTVAVGPDQLARLPIERDHGSPCAGGG